VGRLAAILTLAWLFLAGALPASALSCEEMVEPPVLDAANRPAVSGVVERETIAANPLPWGRSVAAATRVWGGVRVERWQTTGRRSEDCPRDRYRLLGTVEYDYVAPPQTWDGPVDGTVEVLDVAVVVILDQRYGQPALLEVSGMDRVMAWLRVFPSLLALPVVVFGVIGFFARRRRRAPEYLF